MSKFTYDCLVTPNTLLVFTLVFARCGVCGHSVNISFYYLSSFQILIRCNHSANVDKLVLMNNPLKLLRKRNACRLQLV